MTGPGPQPRPWVRRLRSVEAAAAAGLLFGVLFIYAVGLLSQQPSADASDAEILEWLGDGGNDEAMIRAEQLILAAVIAFLWFIGVFRRRVGDRVDQFTASVFLGSGLILAALLVVGTSLLTAPTVVFGDERVVTNADVYAGLQSVSRTIFLVFANGMAGVFTLTSATMVRRSGAFPSWLSIVGYLIAVSLILSPFDLFEETLVFPIWVMLVSTVILIRRHELHAPVAAG